MDDLKALLANRDKVRVFLKPGKQNSRVVGFNEEAELVVEVNAPPIENRANKALLKLFKDNDIRAVIDSGLTSRHKTVRLG